MTSTTTEPAPVARRSAGDVRAGALAALPLAAGLAPFALAVGAAVSGSADPVAAWAGTLLIFSGSAQLALLQLLHEGTAVWTAVLVATLVNARLVVYSASLAPLWAGTGPYRKLLGGATIVEPTYALAERRRVSGAPAEGALRHYAGAAAVLAVGRTGLVTVGALVGGSWSGADQLAVAVPLCLAGLVAPHLRLPGGVAAVTAAVGTAVCARVVLPGSEVLVAMAAAVVAGTLVAGRRS